MKVGIFGDSWSYCARAKAPNYTEVKTDITFQTLFQPHGIEVKNYSKEGSSNQDIENSVRRFAHQDLDALIVFQTDPLRNLIEKTKLKIIPGYDRFAESLDQMCADLSGDFYWALNTVRQTIQKPVIVVGGLSKLCYEQLPSGLLSMPQSWTELVVPGFKDCYYEYMEPSLLVFETFRHQYNWGSLADFFEIEKLIQAKNWQWQNNDNFGWCHPGINAYKIMTDALIEKLRSIK